MILYITEKASLGRALAAVLPGDKIKEGDHIRCGDNVVAWASGHLLELYEPQDYDDRYKTWSLSDLPIVPKEWKLKPIARTKTLLTGIRALLKDAKEVVNAGDADREGQLLIDEILEFCGWSGVTQRLRINDMNPDAIRKALKEMKDNRSFTGEYRAGQARSFADWLVGMNGSRNATLRAVNAGYDVFFTVGRVQTPTLGLVVGRDREIENFVSKPYFTLHAALRLQGGRVTTGRWQPGENATLDAEGRLVDLPYRDALEMKLTDAQGVVSHVEKKMHKRPPPLPYNLAQLQIDASRKLDLTDTLKYVQSLYEQGYVTYPRSGCPYIPDGHHQEASKILDAIHAGGRIDAAFLDGADCNRKSPAWDDSKVTEHHAIIPTVKVPLQLPEIEGKIYDLIVTRYVLQFHPDHEYRETRVLFSAADETFKATGREIVLPGWTNIEQPDQEDDEKSKEEQVALPTVVAGEIGVTTPVLEEKKTTPPKRFDYASLLKAMNNIHLYVDDPEIRKQLKELDGIGTSATQENIVKLLFDRGFLEKRKKQVLSTHIGRSLIDFLSVGDGARLLVKPDLTALWEQRMTGIEEGRLSLEDFLGEVIKMVSKFVQEAPVIPEISDIPKLKKCLKDNCDGYLRHIKGTTAPFFVCQKCKSIFNSVAGEPVMKKESSGEVVEAECPLGCGKKARRFSGTYGFFWKCFCSPTPFKDVDGQPIVREEREKASCPIKGCKGKAERILKKDNKTFFWKCPTCKNFFDDVDGQPKLQEKKKTN